MNWGRDITDDKIKLWLSQVERVEIYYLISSLDFWMIYRMDGTIRMICAFIPNQWSDHWGPGSHIVQIDSIRHHENLLRSYQNSVFNTYEWLRNPKLSNLGINQSCVVLRRVLDVPPSRVDWRKSVLRRSHLHKCRRSLPSIGFNKS